MHADGEHDKEEVHAEMVMFGTAANGNKSCNHEWTLTMMSKIKWMDAQCINQNEVNDDDGEGRVESE